MPAKRKKTPAKHCYVASNGRHDTSNLVRKGHTFIQRWEQWACPRGCAELWMAIHDWRRVPVPGKVWRSGNQAHTYERTA